MSVCIMGTQQGRLICWELCGGVCFIALNWTVTKCHKAIELYGLNISLNLFPLVPMKQLYLDPLYAAQDTVLNPMVFIGGKSTEALSPAGASRSRCVSYELFLLSHLCIVLSSVFLPFPHWSFRVNAAFLHLQLATRLLKSIGPSANVHPEEEEAGPVRR